MKKIVKKYAGPLMKLTTSQTPRSASSTLAIPGIRYELRERRYLTGASVWAAVVKEIVGRK